MKTVIGVDSGGSKTRALAASLEGEFVAYGESGGGNATHDSASRANVREAIAKAAEGGGIGHVVRVVAGVAGMTGKEEWAAEVTDVPGLAAVCEHLNDSDVGHYAAFGRGAGLLSIQGTGSTIFAVLENGERVRNGDFGHYARGGAVWLGTRATTRAMAGAGPTLAQAVCESLGVADVDGLRRRVRRGWGNDAKAKSGDMGRIARQVTRLAEGGDADARGLCQEAAREIVEGIRLLGFLFSDPAVPVALVGACVRSPAVRGEVAAGLAAAPEKAYRFVEPAVPPVVGAVQMALEAEGVALSPEAARRLANDLERTSPTGRTRFAVP